MRMGVSHLIDIRLSVLVPQERFSSRGRRHPGDIDMTYRIDVEDTSDKVVHTLEFEDAVTIKRAA